MCVDGLKSMMEGWPPGWDKVPSSGSSVAAEFVKGLMESRNLWLEYLTWMRRGDHQVGDEVYCFEQINEIDERLKPFEERARKEMECRESEA